MPWLEDSTDSAPADELEAQLAELLAQEQQGGPAMRAATPGERAGDDAARRRELLRRNLTGQPLLHKPTVPESPSVFDSPLVKAQRWIKQYLGGDDLAGEVADIGGMTGTLNPVANVIKGIAGKAGKAARQVINLGGREIEVTLPAQAARRGDVLAPIDVRKFDQAWANDPAFHIDPSGSNKIGTRLEQVDQFLKTAPAMDAPQAVVNADGTVGFTDGRHRTAYLRDQGVRRVPMSMSPESHANAQRLGLLAPPPVRAYHGSPHDFNRFEFSPRTKGSGEGGAAFGEGLYFAEAPATAESYRSNLAGDPEIKNLKLGSLNVGPHNGFDYSPKGDSVYENIRSSLAEDLLIEQAALAGVPPADVQAYVLKVLDDKIDNVYATEWPEGVAPARELRADLAKRGAVSLKFGKRPGKTYEVALDVAEDELLDWDAPLSQQPAAVQALARQHGLGAVEPRDGLELVGGGTLRIVDDPDFGPKYFLETGPPGSPRFRLSVGDLANLFGTGEMEGKALYQALTEKLGSQAAAGEALRQAGVKGWRYLDAGSRDWADVSANLERRIADATAAGDVEKVEVLRSNLASLKPPSRNYVIPDARLVTILRKYGVAGALAAGYGADAIRQAQQAAGDEQ